MGLDVVSFLSLYCGIACCRDSNNDDEQLPIHDSQNSEEGGEGGGIGEILDQEASPSCFAPQQRAIKKWKTQGKRKT
jgi:hypothetical protein